MSYQFITVRRDGPVEHVTLNRPDVRNAFNEQVIEELTSWASSARQSPGLRVVVIAGAGKVFSAGADAAWMAKMAGYSYDDNVRDARASAATVPPITASVMLIRAMWTSACGSRSSARRNSPSAAS